MLRRPGHASAAPGRAPARQPSPAHARTSAPVQRISSNMSWRCTPWKPDWAMRCALRVVRARSSKGRYRRCREEGSARPAAMQPSTHSRPAVRRCSLTASACLRHRERQAGAMWVQVPCAGSAGGQACARPAALLPCPQPTPSAASTHNALGLLAVLQHADVRLCIVVHNAAAMLHWGWFGGRCGAAAMSRPQQRHQTSSSALQPTHQLSLAAPLWRPHPATPAAHSCGCPPAAQTASGPADSVGRWRVAQWASGGGDAAGGRHAGQLLRSSCDRDHAREQWACASAHRKGLRRVCALHIRLPQASRALCCPLAI